MEKISAVIITKNEEKNIERCLKSVHWVDEIVVVDSGSTDRTIEICKKYGCKIIHTDWLGFGRTKQLSVDSATHDWVLSIDADEEVTTDLAAEIQEVLKKPDHNKGYQIRWRSWYLKKWINHSGWDKEYKMKLFNRNYGRYNDSIVHERIILTEPSAKLSNVLKHYTYPDLTTFLNKMNFSTTGGALVLKERGSRAPLFSAYIHGLATFLKMYILKRGFLDGKVGLILATNYAFTVYYKYLKLWEMRTEK